MHKTYSFKEFKNLCKDPLYTFHECLLADRKTIKKGWGGHAGGVGEIFAWNSENPAWDSSEDEASYEIPYDRVETVKILDVATGKRGSVHLHLKKHELFQILFGMFHITLIKDGITIIVKMNEGDCIRIKPGMVHKIKGIGVKNILLEVSTLDKPEDSYRIERGD